MEMAEVDFANEEEISENVEYLYNLRNELWRTKVLTVCGYLLKELLSAPEYPSLECLRKLILKTSLDKSEYDGISYILKSCPNLESLTFNLSLQRIFQDEATHLGIQDHPFLNGSKYKENGFLFKCLRTLKKVKMLGFKGDFNEMKVIKYLITFGIALKKVHIILSEENGPDGMNMSPNGMRRAQASIGKIQKRTSVWKKSDYIQVIIVSITIGVFVSLLFLLYCLYKVYIRFKEIRIHPDLNQI